MWSRILLIVVFLMASFGSSGSDLSSLEMRAQLGSKKGTMLSAEMPGRIKRIPLEDGERFRRGQLLLEFDCDLQEAQLAKANAQLHAAENTLQGQQRLAELNAIGMVELFNSEAEVLKARADVSYLQVMMRRCRITAPFDGRVIQYGVREHQSVQSSHELVEVMDEGVLELVFLVPSRWLSWLEPGYRFEVQIDDTGKVYPARVLRTAARVDAISQTVRTVAELDGQFPELLPGMSGTVLLRPNPIQSIPAFPPSSGS
jgi:membrane fusion protein (multidrug efflux system)